MAPGVLRGSLELARTLPPGVSSGLADRAAQNALGHLGGAHRDLAGRMTHEVGRWMRRGGLGLILLVPLVVVLTIVAPGRSLMAWSGLARPFELMAGTDPAGARGDSRNRRSPQGLRCADGSVCARTDDGDRTLAGCRRRRPRSNDRTGRRPGIVRAPERHGPNRLLGTGAGMERCRPSTSSSRWIRSWWAT